MLGSIRRDRNRNQPWLERSQEARAQHRTTSQTTSPPGACSSTRSGRSQQIRSAHRLIGDLRPNRVVRGDRATCVCSCVCSDAVDVSVLDHSARSSQLLSFSAFVSWGESDQSGRSFRVSRIVAPDEPGNLRAPSVRYVETMLSSGRKSQHACWDQSPISLDQHRPQLLRGYEKLDPPDRLQIRTELC